MAVRSISTGRAIRGVDPTREMPAHEMRRDARGVRGQALRTERRLSRTFVPSVKRSRKSIVNAPHFLLVSIVVVARRHSACRRARARGAVAIALPPSERHAV